MAILGCPIPGHENDNIIISTRKHVMSMFKTIVLILCMFFMPVIIVVGIKFQNPQIFSGIFANFMVVVGSIYYLTAATFAFTQWISYYYDIFIVTDNEIIDIKQEGIFDRRVTEVSLLRVQDVAARVRGLMPTVFNYGDVVAESAGENTRTYIIDSIPDPVNVANKILELHNEHIAQEERSGQVLTAEGDLRGARIANACPVNSPTPDIPQKNDHSVEGHISKEELVNGGEVKF